MYFLIHSLIRYHIINALNKMKQTENEQMALLTNVIDIIISALTSLMMT